jgi:hypothetical protein
MKHTQSDKWFKLFLIASSIYFIGHFIHAVAQGAI